MLHEHASPQTLGFARLWVFALWFHRIALDPFPQLHQAPLEIFHPIGVLRFLPEPCYAYIFTARTLGIGKGVLLGGLAMLILGLGPYRWIASLTCVLLTFHQGLIRSFGYINHGELGMLYAAYVLAVFPAADALALRRGTMTYAPPGMYKAPMLAVAFILALTYSFVGVRRLVASAPEIFVDGSILRYVAYNSARGGEAVQAYALVILGEAWLTLGLQLGFPLITLCEVLTPLCLISRRWRRVWLGVMVPFHVLTRLLMNISFQYNLLLLLVFFTDLGRSFAQRLPPGWWAADDECSHLNQTTHA